MLTRKTIFFLLKKKDVLFHRTIFSCSKTTTRIVLYIWKSYFFPGISKTFHKCYELPDQTAGASIQIAKWQIYQLKGLLGVLEVENLTDEIYTLRCYNSKPLIPQPTLNHVTYIYIYKYIQFPYIWLKAPLQLGGLEIIVKRNFLEALNVSSGKKNVEVIRTKARKSLTV